jgi:oligopeptide/dipeptide ABC transporter ATP-binding protein
MMMNGTHDLVTPLLAIRDLHLSFFTGNAELRALDGVEFEIERGSTLGLVGESGCGKSATALSIMRLLPERSARITSGEIRLDGRDLVGLRQSAMRRIRGKSIAMIFQDPMTSLNPVVRVGDQIVESIRLHQRTGRKAAREKATELLALVGIADPDLRMQQYPLQLSGGMRQRVVIAIALSCGPSLLLADEPTTALDVTVQAQILDLIGDLQRQFEMGVLLITHDLGVVAHSTDSVAVMYAGRIVERTKTAELFISPRHPYTKGLMASIPGRQPRKTLLHAIPGAVPSAAEWPSGCRFRTRCSFADERCAMADPPLNEVSPGHWVACLKS